MRKISAHLILDGRGNSFTKGILSIDATGTIIDIQETNGDFHESAEVEFYSGILVPGFVNSHCHLELSHLQDATTEGTGFVNFIRQVTRNRNSPSEIIELAAEKADVLMQKNGIVAVGDVANGTSAFETKKISKIDYHTFVEVLGFVPAGAAKAMEVARGCVREADRLGLRASIVPHAPYSVSLQLFNAISSEAVERDSILTIHSQESLAEDELFESGEGEMFEFFKDSLAIDTSFFTPTGESALKSTLKLLPSENHLLMVHNIFSSQNDIEYIRQTRDLNHTWFVLCPGSNLYIQNKIADVELFRKNQVQICLGTDGLCSNHQLSILEEMKIIQFVYPSIPVDELVGWATFNGAKALKIDHWAGSFEVGKRPGVNLLSGTDLIGKRLLPGTRVRKIV